MGSTATLLLSMLLYPLILAGDGCLIIAIALVATSGGNPYLCGAAFAFFHALYAVLGILVTSHLAHYSEVLGELVVVAGALVLLKHFFHHRLHHGARGDCSCEHHQPQNLSAWQIISTAAALSLHALAGGAIAQPITGIEVRLALAAILIGGAFVLGALVSAIVLVGESRRAFILSKLDSLPGVVTGILTGISCYSLIHLLEHLLSVPDTARVILMIVAALVSIASGVWMHSRVSSDLVSKIGRRQGTLV